MQFQQKVHHVAETRKDARNRVEVEEEDGPYGKVLVLPELVNEEKREEVEQN